MPILGRWTVLLSIAVGSIALWTTVMAAPHTLLDDPATHMPGTQPGEVALVAPSECRSCHAGYAQTVEPFFNWQGSMMAQSGRDFLFWPALAVAAQDALWANGTPNATDPCIRCHLPKAWLEARADPPSGAAVAGADFDGVQCDLCHRMMDPFFTTTYAAQQTPDARLTAWDEAIGDDAYAQLAADATLAEDQRLASSFTLYNGAAFYQAGLPFSDTYDESGNSQYFVSPNTRKRASFADGAGVHRVYYSRYHKGQNFCSVCHDVSNPVAANTDAPAADPLPTESLSTYRYAHAQRTYSEFALSAYGAAGGAPGLGPYAPAQFDTSQPNNSVAACQDCHLADVAGYGADSARAVYRPGGSEEHHRSGLPLHDMTGGNLWVGWVLASTQTDSPNYDPINAALLTGRAADLTLDLSQGLGVRPTALLAGVARARTQLRQAATIDNLTYDPQTGQLIFRIQNQTGHKLISGHAEGRRMFVQVAAFIGPDVVYEVNAYDPATGTLTGATSGAALGSGQVYRDDLVYEVHLGSLQTGETHTYHAVLADQRTKDNRIPPLGFRITDAADRLAEPVWAGVSAPEYFTAAEYAGGFDEITLSLPPHAQSVYVRLYYQTVSREYIDFLVGEISGKGKTLPTQTPADPSPYVIQADPFFAQLRGWDTALWELWSHNRDAPGAAPILMAQAGYGESSVGELATGRHVTQEVTGSPTITTTFVPDSRFRTGDTLVLDVNLKDMHTGLALAGATAQVDITGPAHTVLTCGPSDDDGAAPATWQPPTPGIYTVTVTQVTADGFVWDGVNASTSFSVAEYSLIPLLMR